VDVGVLASVTISGTGVVAGVVAGVAAGVVGGVSTETVLYEISCDVSTYTEMTGVGVITVVVVGTGVVQVLE
jgi:hypothetical protein